MNAAAKIDVSRAREPAVTAHQTPAANGLTYRDAGVDIDAGNEVVERIKPLVKRTMRPEVLGGVGRSAACSTWPGATGNRYSCPAPTGWAPS